MRLHFQGTSHGFVEVLRLSLPHTERKLRILELPEKMIHGNSLTSWFFNVREGLINQHFQVLAETRPVFIRLFPSGMEFGCIESSSALRLEPSL